MSAPGRTCVWLVNRIQFNPIQLNSQGMHLAPCSDRLCHMPSLCLSAMRSEMCLHGASSDVSASLSPCTLSRTTKAPHPNSAWLLNTTSANTTHSLLSNWLTCHSPYRICPTAFHFSHTLLSWTLLTLLNSALQLYQSLILLHN